MRSNKALIESPADELKGWVAPEVLVLDHYTSSCDVFSLGVLLWFLLVQREPFPNSSLLDVNRRVVNDSARPPITMKDIGKFRLYDEESGLSYVDLVRKCWAQKIDDRLEIAQVRKVLLAFEKSFDDNMNPLNITNPLQETI